MVTTPSRFREEQAFRQWWIWLIIGLVAAMQWWGFVQQIVLGQPWGNNPASDGMMVVLWLLFGIGLPLFFLYIQLTVTVSDDAIEINLRPLTRRTIPLIEIDQFEARDYAPIREYGGWGIRGFSSNRAYNISGKRGVALVLTGGQKVMIGSQRAEQLAQAIAAAKSAAKGSVQGAA